MKRLCLLATLIGGLGACAATVGEPAYVVSPGHERVSTRWVMLADHYSAETNAQQIMLRGRGEFRQLRIEGERGAPVIKQVTIDYENMSPQIVHVNAQLAQGQGQTIRLNGNGAEVKRVIVYTEPQYGGMYSVFGG
jgi:hypothetical protein